MNQQYEQALLNSWQERQEYAEQMIPMLGKLYREKAVEFTIFGKPLLGASAIEIIKAHRSVRLYREQKLKVRYSWSLLDQLIDLPLSPAKLDLGQLAYGYYHENRGEGIEIKEYLERELADIVGNNDEHEPQDIVLYGFGRIGRLLARLLISRQGKNNKMRLKAIVVRGGKDGDLDKRASLLRRDSVHGPFNGSITVDHERSALKANGSFIQVIYADKPEDVDYTQYGINNAIVIDNTGAWRDEEGLGRHLKSKGAAKVLLTAPGKGDIKNIVYGVNDGDISLDDTIMSAASCTTNAITPVLKALDEKFGIGNGHVETVHSYTNDQNLIDNYHKAERRGRSAPMNMVITETGAAKAVAKAYPKLKGKLTGNAIRVPTPNVSLAILNLNLDKEVTTEQVNDYLREMSLFSDLQEQIDFTASTEIVSTDLVGSRAACVVDSQATITSGDRATLYVWYDNEFGYSCQVVRVALAMAGLTFKSLPQW